MFREMREWAEELSCRLGLDTWSPAARRLGAGIAIVLVALAAWRWCGGGAAPSGVAPMPAAAGTSVEATGARPAGPGTATVDVVGAVRHPGVYRLTAGSRVDDAVSAAGGMLGSADAAAVNLARVLNDGEQIVVPVKGTAATGAQAAGAAASGGAAAGGVVDLNTATVEQLDALPGVGPATAKKIVDDRTRNGPFRTVDDLLRVPGIGPKKLDALKDLVTAR